MTEALLKTGNFTITALTRATSTTKLPEGVKAIPVDYDDHAALVSALTNQDALIITMNAQARDVQPKIIAAAGEAKVSFILPNEWGTDTRSNPEKVEALLNDLPAFRSLPAARAQIDALPHTSYISVGTGFWFEWSMSFPAGFGFALNDRKVTFYDQGEQNISVSTWPQIGRAVAGLLSLPIEPENGDEKHSLEHFRNNIALINSFTVSQKSIFASVLKATGTTEKDWDITYQPVQERFAEGVKLLEGGDFQGFAQLLYARNFYPESPMDFEHTRGTDNAILGIKTEDLDDWTQKVADKVKGGWNAFSQFD